MEGEIREEGKKRQKSKLGAFALIGLSVAVLGGLFFWIVSEPEDKVTKETGLELTQDVKAQQESMKKEEEDQQKKMGRIKDEVYSNPDGKVEEEKESMWSKIVKSEEIKEKVKESTDKESILTGIPLPGEEDAKDQAINFSSPQIQKRVYRDKDSFEIDKENRKLVRENPYVYSNHFRGARYYGGENQGGGGSSNGKNEVQENMNTAMDRLERIMDKSGLNEQGQTNNLGGAISVAYTRLPPIKVSMGEFVECAMLHRLVSDVQESPVNVVVTRDFIDTDRQYVVIPSGTKILGKNQVISYQGAKKLYVWFERMILPNGNNVEFPKSNKGVGLDGEGVAGVSSSVNSHFFQKFGSALLIGILDGLGGLAQNRVDQNSGMSYMIDESSKNFSEITRQMFQQFQNIVPTITVNPGYRVMVYLSSDMNITPYARLSERAYRQ